MLEEKREMLDVGCDMLDVAREKREARCCGYLWRRSRQVRQVRHMLLSIWSRLLLDRYRGDLSRKSLLSGGGS